MTTLKSEIGNENMLRFNLLLLLISSHIANCKGISQETYVTGLSISPAVDRVVKLGTRESGLIIIDCVVQGRATRGVVDTGTSQTVVCTKLTSILPPGKVDGGIVLLPNSVTRATTYEGVNISFGGFKELLIEAIAMDLSSIRQAVGQQVGVIIGMDLLASHVLVLDAVSQPVVNRMPVEQESRTMKKLSFLSGHSAPTLGIEIPLLGLREFVIDTGKNRSMNVTKSLAESMLQSGSAIAWGKSTSSQVGGHAFGKSSIMIREVSLLGVTFNNIIADVARENVVGLELLERFEFTFDFPHGAFSHIDASQVSTSPFFMNNSGIAFAYHSKESIFVLSVVEDSGGHKAGVRQGDELVRLDGRLPSELSRKNINEIVSRVGQTVHASLKRENISYEADIELEYLSDFPPKWKPLPDAEGDFFEFLKGAKDKQKDKSQRK